MFFFCFFKCRNLCLYSKKIEDVGEMKKSHETCYEIWL